MISNNKQQKVLSIISSLKCYGGAGKVMVDIHKGIKGSYPCKILIPHSLKKRHSKYSLYDNECIRFKHPFQLKNSIVLVHSRDILLIIILLNKLLFLNAKIIYISHSVFNDKKDVTLFPKHVIAISNKVKENLISYFNVKEKDITLINNGIKDTYAIRENTRRTDVIKILYLARIDNGKRQIDIVDKIGEKLARNVEIHFAGSGDNQKELIEKCRNFTNLKAIGFIDNIETIINEYDYMMLYSIQEGLPISLIEGIMYKKPLLVNDIGGNLEIGVPEYNAILLDNNWDIMVNQLNNLSDISEENYNQMSENSRQVYLHKFTYSKMIQSYINYIESIT